LSEPEYSDVEDLRLIPEVKEPTPRKIEPIIVHRPAPIPRRVVKSATPKK
jgi:hypothetical protein